MEEVRMGHALKMLFDYQRFEGNGRLDKLILDTEGRYQQTPRALSDDELAVVNAAGQTPFLPPKSPVMEDDGK